MEFYFAPRTISFAALIALEELGETYDLHKVDFSRNEQRSDEFLAKNPKGRVPLLISPDGPISETPAILTYLAQKFPDTGLAPSGVYGFARVQECLAYFASTFHVVFSMKFRGYRYSDDEAVQEKLKEKVQQNMQECAAYVESTLLEGPYLLGEYSIADMHLYAISNWFELSGVTIADYPKLAKWRADMDARDAVKRAWAKADA